MGGAVQSLSIEVTEEREAPAVCRFEGMAAPAPERDGAAADLRRMDRLVDGVEEALAMAMRRLRVIAAPGYPVEQLCTEAELFQRGGKRLRPLLMLSAYSGYGGEARTPPWQAAAALEILHAFALIHDDILDGSIRRRNRPSMPARMRRRFARIGDGEKQGRDLAMLAGDILLSLAVETFLSQAGEPHRIMRSLRLILDAAVYTGSGAFQEVVAREGRARLSLVELLHLYDAKTGVYSFVCPLQVGAVLAGADDRELPRLADFGRQLGRAYQIHDDLDELEAILRDAVPNPICPAETFLLFPVQIALHALPAGDCAALERICNLSTRTQADLSELAALIDKADASREAKRRIEAALRQAARASRRLAMGPDCADRLTRYCCKLVL